MAARGSWKGYLKLSLVTCPVALTPAVSEAERIRLHMLNPETGNRLRSRYVDQVTGDPVEDDEQVMGWPAGADDYVILEDEELDAIAIESNHTIDIARFVPRDRIDRLWLDGAHYLTPDDPVGEEAFAVIRAAMAATGKVGIARLVMNRRERHVMLQPCGKGIVVWTLRVSGEIRDDAEPFAPAGDERAAPDALEAAMDLVEARTAAWDPDLIVDAKDAALERLIASKRKGRRKAPPKREAEEPVDTAGGGILAALRRSLEREKGGAGPAAGRSPAEAERPAAKSKAGPAPSRPQERRGRPRARARA